MIPARFYAHKLYLLFNSLHILRQLFYCACAVFRLDFRLCHRIRRENQHSSSMMISLNEFSSSPSAVNSPRKLFPASISALRSTWFANSSINGAKRRYACINCFIFWLITKTCWNRFAA